MKTITNEELHRRLLATQNSLAHLKTETSHRRHTWNEEGEVDFHSIGNPFVRDLDVIFKSKAWRRMSGKNQVASSPFDSHLRNRETHVIEVLGCSSRIAEHLGLNVFLAQAIAAGHDLGHVPFGHQGEHYIQKKTGSKFTHEVMGTVILQCVERRGHGCNVTWATLEGVHGHSGNNAKESMTPEGWVVRYADKIAYLFADYNDFDRMQWQCQPKLVELMNWFGFSQRDRTLRTAMALYEESVSSGRVIFEKSEAAINFNKLRKLMYYEYERVVEQDVSVYLEPVWNLLDRSGVIPPWLGISLLTDNDICRLLGEHRVLRWKSIMDTGLGEIIKKTPQEVLWGIKPELDLNW